MTSDESTPGPAAEWYNLVDRSAGLGVLFAGWEQTVPRHRVRTVRDHFLFHYVLSGRGSFHSGSRRWSLKAGQGFLIVPGHVAHYASDGTDPWAYLWVGFHGKDAARLLPQVGLDADHPVLESAPDPRLEERLRGLLDILRTKGPGYSLAAEGQLWLILADCARLSGPHSMDERQAKLQELSWPEVAAEFIQMNFPRRITVAEVAQYVGFHPSHLGRLFRARYGVSVQQWLLRVRMEHAKLLLRTTDHAVGAIAASVGFRDYPSFAKRFHAENGISPGAYRRGSFYT